MADKEFQLKIEPDKEHGVYSNAVSVHFGNEVTLDFGYHMPKVSKNNTPTIKLVSRVILNPKTAESFLKILSNAVLDWKNKQKDSDK